MRTANATRQKGAARAGATNTGASHHPREAVAWQAKAPPPSTARGAYQQAGHAGNPLWQLRAKTRSRRRLRPAGNQVPTLWGDQRLEGRIEPRTRTPARVWIWCSMLKDAQRYRLMPGDALSVLRGMPGGSVDAVVTDPPYCSGAQTMAARVASTGKKYGISDTRTPLPDFEGDFRDQRGYLAWASLWLAECHRIVQPGGVLLAFIDWRMLPTMTDAVQVAGFVWQGLVVWDKTTSGRPQLGRFRSQAEFVVWGSRGPLNVGANPVVLPGVHSIRPRADVKLHQVGKPEALMSALVEIVRPGGIVLDPFMGSGTTGVAALRSNRRFIGCELSPGYFEVARQRLAAESEGR